MISFTSRMDARPTRLLKCGIRREVDLRNSANLALRNDEQWLTVRRVATRLDVSADTVRRWIRTRKLTAAQFGGKAGYRRSDGFSVLLAESRCPA